MFVFVHSRMLSSINSQARAECRNASRFARKASSIVAQCTQTSADTRGGSGSHDKVISVRNASVPSDPASRRQKLKGGPAGTNGEHSASKSIAYPVFRRWMDFFGNSRTISARVSGSLNNLSILL